MSGPKLYKLSYNGKSNERQERQSLEGQIKYRFKACKFRNF